ADGVGFLAAVEAVAHPPELAGPALVRRDEEVESAAGHVGNLGGAPHAIVEFRSGFVRNSESRRERLFSRYQHDTNKSDGRDRMRTNGDEHRCTRKDLFFKGLRALRGRLRTLWNGLEQPSWCPWPDQAVSKALHRRRWRICSNAVVD